MKPCVYFKCWHCCKELYFTCSRIPRSAFGTWKHWFDFSGQNTVERDENDLSTMRCAIWYHLYNLKKREKHPWRTVTFSKLAKSTTLLKVTFLHGSFPRFWIVQMVPNSAKHHMLFMPEKHFKAFNDTAFSSWELYNFFVRCDT